jgi:thiol-disulfide isomerase/thioredoxin
MLSPVAAAQNEEATTKAPSLILKDMRGRTLRLNDYRGHVVLLNFWATWCAPCRAEMPDLVKWQRKYRGSGLQVIGVTYPPTEPAKVRRFIRRIRVNYPIVIGAKETKSLFDAGETLPFTVIIDRDGNVRGRVEGIMLEDEFKQMVKPLLR